MSEFLYTNNPWKDFCLGCPILAAPLNAAIPNWVGSDQSPRSTKVIIEKSSATGPVDKKYQVISKEYTTSKNAKVNESHASRERAWRNETCFKCALKALCPRETNILNDNPHYYVDTTIILQTGVQGLGRLEGLLKPEEISKFKYRQTTEQKTWEPNPIYQG